MAGWKLSRRHEKTCTGGYKKEDRIREGDSVKATGRAQCECVILVDGQVGNEYLRKRSTGCRDYESARKIVSQWERQSEGRPKDATSASVPGAGVLQTVSGAIESFYVVQRNKGVSDDRMKQYEQLLTLRLLQFTRSRNFEYIQEMDKAEVWASFRNTWRNLNSHRNRKDLKPDPNAKLEKGTVSRMISDLRIFINHCISNEWLSDNWAAKKHGMVTTKVVDPKDPFSDRDVMYTFQAAEHVSDGRWGHTGTQNGFEDLVFAYVLRYTGLRISDVCALKGSQLVSFPQAPWTHAISCHPKKTSQTRSTGNHVLIPIPNNLPGHPNVVAALQALPLKHGEYFFLGGDEVPPQGTKDWEKKIKYATNGWRERIGRLFKIAKRLMKKEGVQFSVHPQPHRFRHTFAAWLLQGGMSLRQVAEYLGDTEQTVRKHYGKFCRAEQLEAARAMARAIGGGTDEATAVSGPTGPWRQLQS